MIFWAAVAIVVVSATGAESLSLDPNPSRKSPPPSHSAGQAYRLARGENGTAMFRAPRNPKARKAAEAALRLCRLEEIPAETM
ncbi:hypothetical protein GCM10008171_16640 [Methylopila jiangsuensis]|uniref:Uncharacterized protein n=1 Tax=Methylopila jiangsuensis TaxID=586230 RepID=A0A9W6JF14_9HYPH|nr:hypothetical protein GCM10008171_16640 [Methylopila jiangsuensis]